MYDHETVKLHLRQLENVNEVDIFYNNAMEKIVKFRFLLIDVELYNLHKDDKSFKNKVEEIEPIFNLQAAELDDLIANKKNELLNKGLSSERIQQFLQFEADMSHVGDQCQVCLEEVEVGRLMKQLDCGGRHYFCSGCIDQWFADHKTCPICRHVFE